MEKPNKVKYWFKNWLAEWSHNDNLWTCVIVKVSGIRSTNEEVLGEIIYPSTVEPSISISIQTKNNLRHES